MIPLITGAARVLATSTRAASIKGSQSAASIAKGATVESKAIDKFVKLNDKLSKNNRRDNKDNLTYMRRMEKSIFNMQKSMDSISRNSKSFMNNMKMLVGLGGVGGMLYSFLKITESYGSPQARFRGKVTSTSLRDQKAFEQMLAIKGINKPDLLNRLGMAATEGGIIGTKANQFFSKYGISPDKFLAENSAGRLSMVLDKWENIKTIPSISKFFEEFLGSSWAELKAMREIGDLKTVYNEKYGALKDTDLNKFSKLHESLENIKQNVLNKLVGSLDKITPLIERVANVLGNVFLNTLEKISNRLKGMDDKQIANKIEGMLTSIVEFVEGLMNLIIKMDKFLDKFGFKREFHNYGEIIDALSSSEEESITDFKNSLSMSGGKYTDKLGSDADVLRLNNNMLGSFGSDLSLFFDKGVKGFFGLGSLIYNKFAGNKAFEKDFTYDRVASKYNILKEINDEKVRKNQMTEDESKRALSALTVRILDDIISTNDPYRYRKRNLTDEEKNYLYNEIYKSTDPGTTLRVFIEHGMKDINQQPSTFQYNKQ